MKMWLCTVEQREKNEREDWQGEKGLQVPQGEGRDKLETNWLG